MNAPKLDRPPDGIDNGEPHLSWRQAGQEPEHRRLKQHCQGRRSALGRGLDQQIRIGRKVLRAGNTNDAGTPSIRRASAGIPRGSAAARPGPFPKRTTGGTTRGKGRSARALVPVRTVAVDFTVNRSTSAARFIPSHQRSAILRQAISCWVVNCSLSVL